MQKFGYQYFESQRFSKFWKSKNLENKYMTVKSLDRLIVKNVGKIMKIVEVVQHASACVITQELPKHSLEPFS